MSEWTRNRELSAISPAPIRGLRDQAFLRATSHLRDLTPRQRLLIQNAQTCPASALPALIAEYSVEEFIAPGLPEARVRAIIAASWLLHEAKGYDQGVKAGLALLGIEATITHWYETDPKGPPNTHRIEMFPTEQVYLDEGVFGARHLLAALTMIDGTKRLSQGTTLVRARKLRHTDYFGHILRSATRTVVNQAGQAVPLPPAQTYSAMILRTSRRTILGVA